jgi:hypothetical protein
MADTEITITEDVTTVAVTASTPVSITTAGGIGFTPFGHVGSTNVQNALEEVIDQFSVQATNPESPAEGQLFYDTDDNLLQVYADTDGGTQWITLLRAGSATDMTKLDGGSF